MISIDEIYAFTDSLPKAHKEILAYLLSDAIGMHTTTLEKLSEYLKASADLHENKLSNKDFAEIYKNTRKYLLDTSAMINDGLEKGKARELSKEKK